jgi:eukaryotic-like serine/threonine-protein kinase
VARVLEPNHVFADRFVLERLAGTGGMGRVYRTLDRVTGMPVALKLLLDPQGAERFAREARLLAELEHPGIVRYIAHGQSSDGEIYIAMEWIEGETLSARLKREPLSARDALDLVTQIADALAAAHRRGIVHRDIKPANLLLAGGRIDRAKLVDFGIAHLTDATATVTRTGAVLGTLGYMAPEQARGESNPGPAADVFSLGCVLFHCLTGRPAFAGATPMAVLAKLIMEEAPRLHELRPELPAALADLVAHMLSKEPSQRPQDAGAVLAALRSLELAALDAPAPGRSAHVDVLTGAEQRLVCVLLAHQVLPKDLFDGDETRTQLDGPATSPSESSFRSLRALATRHGASLEPLRDGSIAALITGSASSGGAATDLTVRAARCALEMRGLIPSAPIALATGRRVVAARLPVGDVIERAAAMVSRAHAEPAAIVVDRMTAGLLDVRFEVGGSEHGTLLLTAERKLGDVRRKLLGAATTTIGRERELAFLTGLFEECSGEPVARVVTVVGPAGIGKSRLRYEFIRRIDARRPAIWIARGDPVGAGSPFGLLGQIVRRAAGIFDGEPLAVSREKLQARVGRHVADPDAERVAAFLGEIARVPHASQGRPELEAARRDAVLMGDQTRRAWIDFVLAECRSTALLLVLEDLHWGDLPTVNFVDAALRAAADLPLMVLALARPEVTDQFGQLWPQRAPQELRLGPLTRKAAEKLVHEVLGAKIAPELVSSMIDRSEGNAFFLEELIRSVAEGETEALPETLIAMVQARLEALPDGARRVLRAASLFGGVFWDGAVARMTGQELASGEVDDWLRLLVDRELVAARAQSRFPGARELVFRHALVREAAYEMLTPADRELGHRLAGSWLEDSGEPDAIVLASHFERARAADHAFRWYRVAADEALEANDFKLALTAVDRAQVLGAGSVQSQALAELERLRAEALYWTGQHQAALDSARRGLELLEAGSDPWYATAALVSNAAHRAGDIAAVIAIGRRLLDEGWAERPGAAAVIGSSRVTVALTQNGHYALADDILARVAPNLDALGDDPGARARWELSSAARALYIGRVGDYLVLSARAAENSRLAGDLRGAAIHLHNVGHAHVELGLYAEAEHRLRAALREAERLGLPNVVAATKNNLGFAVARLGRAKEGIALLRDSIQALDAQADLRMYGGACNHLALVLGELGLPAEAELVARQAVEALRTCRPLLCQAQGTLARVLLNQGRVEEALTIARAATALLLELGSMADGEIALRLTMAEATRAAGDEPAARAELAHTMRRLMLRADAIDDQSMRLAFLHNVPEHARTLELYQQLGALSGTPL